jgi:hypothetical protein
LRGARTAQSFGHGGLHGIGAPLNAISGVMAPV